MIFYEYLDLENNSMQPKLIAQHLTLPGSNGGTTEIQGIANFKFDSIGKIISSIIPFVIAFAGIGLLVMIIFSGFGLLTSAGDAKKAEAAKNRLTYAVIGFFIIFLAFWIVQLAGIMFGLDAIKTPFGS